MQPSPSSPSTFAARFQTYFERDVARKAAQPLAKSASIQLLIQRPGVSEAEESFYYHQEAGQPTITPGQGASSEVTFVMTPGAAASVLDDPSEEIGRIGVNILKLVISGDPDLKIRVRLQAGILGLISKGYLGVITAGGAEFAGFLATKGLGSMGAIKDAIKKLRSGT